MDAHAEGDEYTLPHGSGWPWKLAVGIMFLYLGVLWTPFFVAGLVVLLYGIVGTIKEDMHWWADRIATGPRNGWYGVVFFLCTEVMLFGALFATYFNTQANADVWPPADVHLPIVKTGINTLILLASGATAHWAHTAIRNGDRTGFLRGMLATIVLGAIFLAGQVYEYLELFGEGMRLGSSTYAASFYSLTGTHGFHVLGGLILLCIVGVRGWKGQFTKERHIAVEVTAIYWHFVDAVWVLLYAIVYLHLV